MDRLARLKRNPRLLFWARACLELKALNAIIALFYLNRGVHAVVKHKNSAGDKCKILEI